MYKCDVVLYAFIPYHFVKYNTTNNPFISKLIKITLYFRREALPPNLFSNPEQHQQLNGIGSFLQ